jgi:flagellar basal-body rod modification protein FlgD
MQVTATGSGSGNYELNKTLGKDDFLKLLVTQLRYQDPMQPVDDKEFIAQLAQFSSLEQIQNLNSTMEQFITINLIEGQLSRAAALVGQEVQVYDPRRDASIEGKVEAVRMFDGVCKLVIDGEMHDLHQLEEIRGVKK